MMSARAADITVLFHRGNNIGLEILCSRFPAAIEGADVGYLTVSMCHYRQL